MARGVVDGYVGGPLTAIERELVETHRQRSAGLPSRTANRLSDFVNRPLVQLHRRQAEPRVAEGKAKCFDRIAGAVHRDRMIVRIDRPDVVGKSAQPLGAEVEIQVVLLAQIPLERQVMAESGYHFAVVELPLGAELAVVQLALVGRLGLVEHEMQEDPQSLRVAENGLPLAELRNVEMAIVVVLATPGIDRTRPRPNVFTIAADVHRQEVDAVDVLASQIVEGADDRPPAAGSPVRIAFMPICFVVCVAMFRRRAIEAGVGQQVFGFVRAAPQPIGAV